MLLFVYVHRIRESTVSMSLASDSFIADNRVIWSIDDFIHHDRGKLNIPLEMLVISPVLDFDKLKSLLRDRALILINTTSS